MMRRVGLLLSILFCIAGTVQAQTCTRWASPTGGGTGLSQASPYQIASFWATAAAGSVLCLLDGTYTGANSMIDPPDATKGASGNPITVRALNEGQVLITGQNSRRPVSLDNDNDWFVVQGINACCSNGGVVVASDGSDNNVIRRVVAWNAADGNTEVFGAHASTGTLFEDVAGFGIARKIFQFSQGGDSTTCRRCWGRWERSTWVGPKMTYTLAYNNYSSTVENSLGQWSGAQMPASYNLGCPAGSTYPACGTTITGGAVDQPYGIFSADDLAGAPDSNTMLLGSMAYVLGSDDFRGVAPVRLFQLGLDIAHIVSYITPGTHTSKPAYVFAAGGGTSASTADHITGVSTASNAAPSALWTVTNTEYVSSVGAADSIFTGPNGAAICYRYQDRTLTANPLWPWPMNQRIIDATTSAGVTVINVTSTIESIWGTIPAQCRWDVATLEPPINFHKVSP